MPPTVPENCDVSSTTRTSTSHPIPATTTTHPWDGWPDGTLSQDFPKGFNIFVHWACKGGGGDRSGSENAEEWEKGKRARRICLGVIKCDNPDCDIVIRPKTDKKQRRAQLDADCQCGATLELETCAAYSIAYDWKDGIHYEHTGYHHHSRPQALHLTASEKADFEEIVRRHPQNGPLSLVVGVPEMDGTGKSVADISDVLINADRVGHERRNIKKKGKWGMGEGFIEQFAQ